MGSDEGELRTDGAVMWMLLAVLSVAALVAHSFAMAGVLAGAALFMALTSKP